MWNDVAGKLVSYIIYFLQHYGHAQVDILNPDYETYPEYSRYFNSYFINHTKLTDYYFVSNNIASLWEEAHSSIREEVIR